MSLALSLCLHLTVIGLCACAGVFVALPHTSCVCVCECVSHRIAAFLLTICFMVCPSGTAPLSQSQFNTPYTSQYLPSHSQNIYNAV